MKTPDGENYPDDEDESLAVAMEELAGGGKIEHEVEWGMILCIALLLSSLIVAFVCYHHPNFAPSVEVEVKKWFR